MSKEKVYERNLEMPAAIDLVQQNQQLQQVRVVDGDQRVDRARCSPS
jgi:hypothetical protein